MSQFWVFLVVMLRGVCQGDRVFLRPRWPEAHYVDQALTLLPKCGIKDMQSTPTPQLELIWREK